MPVEISFPYVLGFGLNILFWSPRDEWEAALHGLGFRRSLCDAGGDQAEEGWHIQSLQAQVMKYQAS